MPKAGDDIVICVGRESIEALATGEPVKVGDNEYLLQADSYDHPYKRIAELEAELATIRNGDVVVLPKNRQHAAAMHLIAERWLADSKQQ